MVCSDLFGVVFGLIGYLYLLVVGAVGIDWLCSLFG